MKKTNKIITVLMLILSISIVFSIASFATGEELSEGATENTPKAETSVESEISGATEDVTEPATLTESVLAILSAVVGEDFMKIVSLVFDTALLIYLAVLRKSTTSSVSEIGRVLFDTSTSVTEKYDNLKAIVEAEKELLTAFKGEIMSAIEKKFGEYVTKEQMLEIVELEKAQLDIFDTIYQKSSTISLPTKDQLTMIHNEALKRVAKLEGEEE